MSKCDQNCLLSRLWDNGSSLAILDISNSKKRAVSNRFIKKMCHGEDRAWDVGDVQTMQRRNVFSLSFSHLSVTPREIMEARGFQHKDTVCLLFEETNADGVKGRVAEKIMALGYLPFDKLIHSSLYAITKDPEEILRLLSNRELEEFKKMQGKPYRLFGFQFKWCTEDTPRKKLRNVGGNKAMKRIFMSDETSTRTIVAGDIPIVTKGYTKDSLSCDFGTYFKTTYKRTLYKPVQDALGRQKDYRKCLHTSLSGWSKLLLIPYNQDIFVKQWAVRIKDHITNINRSGFLKKNGSPIQKYNMLSVDISTFFKRQLLFQNYNIGEAAFFAPINLDVKDWYKLWLEEYKKDLRKAKTMRHSEIIADIVHTHYSNLKTKSHRNVSIKWLREKNLLGKA